ncbi:MAG: DUF167 domain-containing protein [Proteobacteria bacterium]|nr:DUF167 domain-containing protein [Pseudomonadota bacterium]
MPGDRILVRVTPKASRNEVVVESAQEGAPPKLRVYITTVPEDGKANKATIALLSKFLKVPKSRLTLICGHTSRDKIFQLS